MAVTVPTQFGPVQLFTLFQLTPSAELVHETTFAAPIFQLLCTPAAGPLLVQERNSKVLDWLIVPVPSRGFGKRFTIPEVLKLPTFCSTPKSPPLPVSTNDEPFCIVKLPVLLKLIGLVNEGLMVPLRSVCPLMIPKPLSVPAEPTVVLLPRVPPLKANNPPATLAEPVLLTRPVTVMAPLLMVVVPEPPSVPLMINAPLLRVVAPEPVTLPLTVRVPPLTWGAAALSLPMAIWLDAGMVATPVPVPVMPLNEAMPPLGASM